MLSDEEATLETSSLKYFLMINVLLSLIELPYLTHPSRQRQFFSLATYPIARRFQYIEVVLLIGNFVF